MIKIIISFFSPCLRVSVAILLCAINLSAQEFSQSLNANWQFTEAGKNEWLSATVPGTVHTDLSAHGKIPDPYMGTNESKVQWVETKTWEYKTTFDAGSEVWKAKHKELIFEGLDTYAFVYLNDSLILTGENMFRSYTVNVTKQLKKTKNVLRIVFHPASELIEKNKKVTASGNLPGGDRVFIRKAQYQFGWDWGPRLVTSGIWKSIRLEGKNDLMNPVFRLQTDSLKNDTAYCSVTGYTTNADAAVNLEISSGGKKYAMRKKDMRTKKGFCFTFTIAHPRLWWCNGMGKPNLYEFNLVFKNGKETTLRTVKTGIRTIKLDQSQGGFAFILNNEPVFIKGANWISNDNFLPRITTGKQYSLVKSVQESNMNMLRVWGGGVYESDDFYNDCDSLGILVWQDLMFAGGIYPSEHAFLMNYLAEVTEQSFRIGRHSCLALWCGNNEIEEGWKNWGWQKELNISSVDSAKLWTMEEKLFNELGQTVCYWDSSFNYISSSPATGWGHPEAYTSGDVHYWGVWWGNEPFSAYDTHVGRFVSEYGFQGTPPLSSFALFDADGNFSLNDSTTRAHQKHPKGFETINAYMARDYPVPAAFSDYVYVSQVMQREGVSRAIAAHRRAMPYCMGTLFWQYNDCWPVTSWSSVDYYGQKKLLQYALKDMYAPLLISVTERNDSVLIYLVNDDTVSHKGLLAFAWMDLNGTTVRTSFTPTSSYAGRSNMVLGFQKKQLLDTLKAERGVLHLVFNYENNKNVTANYYFVNTKSLALSKDPGLITDLVPVAGKSGAYTLTLRTVSLAKNVYVSLNDATATFSDNGFDMLAGETKDVIITTLLSAEQLKAALRIQMMNTLIEERH